ncbi:MAG: nucleotidyl transferase AbiEii/AbiGii toxin family protein [Deltaproteobacteria bacterium]|nr:nucleotidyl transferase AbiEii/AbiGii toxin family protein [Deltaproteobacteria bacterium]
MSEFHVEVLDRQQLEVLKSLAPVLTPRAFYLAGGTAVALQLGHRRSIDLDWFSNDRIADPLDLAGELRAAGLSVEVAAVAPNTLHASVSGVRVSFLAYRYPLLRPLSTWTEVGCDLASLQDLACMKLAAVAQRGSRRDFLDIAAIGKTGTGLADMLEWYKQKYALEDIGHVLVGLCYFDDADREPMPDCLEGTDWEATKAIMRSWVKGYVGAAPPPGETR